LAVEPSAEPIANEPSPIPTAVPASIACAGFSAINDAAAIIPAAMANPAASDQPTYSGTSTLS
jgi:hypothetical protein